MKATICVTKDFDKGEQPVGTIQTVSGKAIASMGAKDALLPKIFEPETLAELTPADGDRYVEALPATFAGSSRISAYLEGES